MARILIPGCKKERQRLRPSITTQTKKKLLVGVVCFDAMLWGKRQERVKLLYQDLGPAQPRNNRQDQARSHESSSSRKEMIATSPKV